MTLISFVVPVYRVQGYLRRMPGLDARPAGDRHRGDRRRRLLAGRQRRHPRPSTRPATSGSDSVRLPENVGLGPARNIGLDRRRRRVRVVRRQRRLAGRRQCLTAVADRLRGTRPGRAARRPRPGPLGRHGRRAVRWPRCSPESPGTGTFRLRDRPEAMRLLHTAWNKVGPPGVPGRPGASVRTRLVRGRLVHLPGADGGRSGSALLDRVCVNYRQRRAGAITRTGRRPALRGLPALAPGLRT